MAADGSIIIDTNIDTKGFGKGATNLKSQFSGLAGAAKKLGAAIGGIFAIKQIVQFGKEAIDLGSDLQEVQNVVDVTFGNMSGAVNEFAQNALEQFGLSELAAKQYSSTMGAMLKSMGFTTEQAAAMSTEMAGLAGDMASFYNLSGDDAFAKIRAGISGETEPLKQLGINLSVANLEQYALTQGITKSYNAMTQQEQALLRYNYLLSVTSDAQGDFSRTSESWANQTRILSERFNSLKATIGQGLINALTPVIKVINTILAGLQAVADAFAQFTALLFGNAGSVSTGASAEELNEVADGYSAAAGGAEDLADATEAAGKAAKKSLAAFDEINTLGGDSSGSGSADTAAVGGGFAADVPVSVGAAGEIQDNISPQIEGLVSKIKELLAPLQNIDFTALKTALSGLGSAFGALGSTIGDALEWAWFNILVPLAEWTIEEAAPAVVDMLTEAFEALNVALEPVGAGLQDLLGYLKPVFDYIEETVFTNLETFESLFRKLAGVFKEKGPEVQGIISGIGEIFAKVWAIIEPILEEVRDVVGIVFEYIGDVADDLIDMVYGIVEFVAGVFSLDWGRAWEGICTAFDGFWGRIEEIASTAWEILQEIWSAISDWFDENVISPIVGFFSGLWEDVENLASDAWEGIKGVFDDASGWFDRNVVQPISGFFSGLWSSISTNASNAWLAVKNVFRGVSSWFASFVIEPIANVFSGLGNTLKGTINGLIGLLNRMISGLVSGLNAVIGALNKINIKIPDWVPVFGGSNFGFNLGTITAPQIPYLAQGAVIPPNREFLAVLGDQKSGTNIEAPLETIKQALAEVMASQGTGDVNVNISGDLAPFIRWLKVEIDRENHRVGGSFAKGATIG